MTYDDFMQSDFMQGLIAKYHYVVNSSVSVISNDKNKGGESITFQDIVALIVDAEKILKKIKNKNMVKALELMAQGYLQWEIAEMLRLSLTTIKHYPSRVKKYLK